MSELPTGWRAVRLGDVVETSLGKMLDRGRTSGHQQVPYLRNVNVQWGHIDIGDLRTMEIAEADLKRFAVEDGDLLVCEGGEIGRAALWRGRTEYIAYQKALHRVRSTGEMNTAFLRYLLEWYASNGTLKRYSTGSTISHLPQQLLRALPVKLPPLEEQQRIVDILEQHLSRLDAATVDLDRCMRRLASLRVAKLAQSSGAADGHPETLESLAVCSGYGTSEKCVLGGPGPAVIRIPNVINGSIDLRDEKRASSAGVDLTSVMVAPGDLLIVRTNGSRGLIGRAAVVEEGVAAAFASRLLRFRLDGECVRPRWVLAMLETSRARKAIESAAASSAGQFNLSLAKLNGLNIPTPSLAVQDFRLGELAVVDSEIRTTQKAVAASGVRSTSLRRELLSAAFSGRLSRRSGQSSPSGYRPGETRKAGRVSAGTP